MGSPFFSSKVFLVEVGGKNYVLKKTDEPEWVISEKEFYRILRENEIPTLNYLESDEIELGDILLEYVDGSVNIGDRFTE